jgi:hypothetical protein
MTALKVSLYRSLREAGLTRAELMRRLGWNRESVDRLFRLDHASRLDHRPSRRSVAVSTCRSNAQRDGIAARITIASGRFPAKKVCD